jgi:hypothetical protein
MGMVVWAEIPIINYITESVAFYDNAKQQLIELVRQNYNHPSIMFWSVENEVTLQTGPDPAMLISQLASLVSLEDSTRISTVGSNANDADKINWYTDAVAFNKYFGWYSGKMADFGSWADGVHSGHPSGKFGVSEYGVGANTWHHEDNPAQPSPGGDWHPEEYQSLFHESHWKQMATRPFLWCKTIWNMFDFAVDNRNEGSQPGINDKGLVTYDRAVKKDAFYWYKANWSNEPFVYITSRRFTPRDTSEINVKAYSNCHSLELFVNGISKGSKSSTDHIFTWAKIPIPLKDNQIKVVGTQSNKQYSDSTIIGYFGSTEVTLSKGKAATANTFQAGNGPANAVDENSATRWCASDSTFPQWWMVDLGVNKDIGSVRISWYTGNNHRQYQYKIELSENSNSGFTTVADRSKNVVSGITEDSITGIGRYMRIMVSSVIPRGGWAGFYDVKIYEHVRTAAILPVNGVRQLHIATNGRDVHVEFPFAGVYCAALYDLRGRQLLKSEGITSGIVRIRNAVSSGSYLFTVRFNNQEIRKKIVVR